MGGRIALPNGQTVGVEKTDAAPTLIEVVEQNKKAYEERAQEAQDVLDALYADPKIEEIVGKIYRVTRC